MKELAAILAARKTVDRKRSALATIVRTEGSSYRRAGAQMLILPDGATIGSISGGCLEQDVIAHAQGVCEKGAATLLSYDTTPEEDVLFGVGLGCKGVIEIWLEPLEQALAMLDYCENIFRENSSDCVALKFRGERAGSREIGAVQTSEDPETFFQLIQAPAPLFIFGGGYDAIPLARMAKELGYAVTVIDRRPAYATRERFPDADAVLVKAPSDALELKIADRSAAVVMSHHYVTDRDFLKALLPLPLTYLGLMGPRRRAETMLQEIRDEGLLAGEELLQKLHNPVGLDIGAEGPEQIALAILSEINAVFAGHGAGMLREKKGPIHSPRTELK